jgi:hypothetical protein
MDIEPLTILDELIDGRHERCAWCRAPFVFSDGKFDRVRAADGKFYCNADHASAPYIREQWNGTVRALRR